MIEIECPECHGEGETVEDVIDWTTVIKYRCWFCKGKGRVSLLSYIGQWLYNNVGFYCRFIDWWHDK